ncbi:MAG: hypothetical protein HY720_26870 [Planctomycetes bacterium]|nr:hypothetical protein [Planctomycetota bacterium]
MAAPPERCPDCAEPLPANADSCPMCGRWLRESPREERTRPRGRAARAAALAVAPAETWTRVWGNVCGILLVLAFFWPILVVHYQFGAMFGQPSQTVETVFTWDLVAKTKGVGPVLFFVLPPLAGVFVLIAANVWRGVPRSIMLFAAGGGVLAIFLLAALAERAEKGEEIFAPRLTPVYGLFGICFPIYLAGAGLAVGNRLRKRHPESREAGLVAGAFGAFLLLCFFLPVGPGDQILLSVFAEEKAWEDAWSVLLILVLVFAYAVMGIVGFARPKNVGPLCTTTSVLGKVILFGGPAFLALSALGEMTSFEYQFSVFAMSLIKMCLYGHGLMILPAVGFTSLLDQMMARRA